VHDTAAGQWLHTVSAKTGSYASWDKRRPWWEKAERFRFSLGDFEHARPHAKGTRYRGRMDVRRGTRSFAPKGWETHRWRQAASALWVESLDYAARDACGKPVACVNFGKYCDCGVSGDRRK